MNDELERVWNEAAVTYFKVTDIHENL